MLNKSTDTPITNDEGWLGMSVSNMSVSFEDYRKDIKPEAFDARANSAFLSEEAWGG